MDKIQIIENLFDFLFQYSFLLPVLAFMATYGSIKAYPNAWVILAYSIIFFLFNLTFEYFNGPWLKVYYAFYTLFEFLFFAAIFLLIIKRKPFRQAIITLSILFLGFEILYYFNSNIRVLDSVPIGVASILVFIFIFLYLFEQFQTAKASFLYNNPSFWFVLGILMYISGSFFFNILINDLSKDHVDKYWFLTFIFDIVRNILFAIGILRYSKYVKMQLANNSRLPYLDFS